MKKNIMIVMILTLTAFIFTGCKSDDKVVLNVYNWGDYIDEDIFDTFEEETGIKIKIGRAHV